MAVINDELPTLSDMAKRLDPKGAIAKIAERLTKKNAFLMDAVVQEGNLPTGHVFTSRTALPSVYWRRLNEGVAPSKSRTAQVTETCGMLEGNSVVDCALAKLNGNEAAFRASEDAGFVQAMNNEVDSGIVYHSTKTSPEKIMGLVPRLDSTSGVGGGQIIKHDAAAAGSDQTSILIVGWSPDTAFLTYPKGSNVGLTPYDMGIQLWDDGTGKKFRAYVTNWQWHLGLVVKDWRYVVRIANIDTSNLAATGNALIQSMVKGVNQLHDLTSGRYAIYANRTVHTFLQLQAMDSVKNSTLKIEEVEGKPVTSFMGIPVRQSDSILNDEAVVS